MTIEFLYENGKGSVVDEYDRPEPMDSIPMDSIVDEEQFSSWNIELSYTIFSSTASPRRVSEW